MATDGETVARAFHETYERLAPEYGYETRRDSSVPWDRVPERNRTLMVAVAQELPDRGTIRVPRSGDDHRCGPWCA